MALTERLSRWTLGAQLAWSMLLVAVLTVAGLFYNMSLVNRQEIQQLQTDYLRTAAQEMARRLDALVRDEHSRIANLARSRAARQFISVPADQRSALFAPTLDDFSNFIASNPAYRAVLLLDGNGEVLISTEGSYVGQRFAHNPVFDQAMQGQVALSDPGISPLDRQPVLWLAAPVAREGGVETLTPPKGVVVVALSPEELWIPIEALKIGTGGYAMLVDQYGIRLAHGLDRRYIFRSLGPLPVETWLALQAAGRFGPLPAIDETGSTALLDYIRSEPLPAFFVHRLAPAAESVIYSAARMETRPWTVITMRSEREAFLPAHRVTFGGLGATVLLTMLLGITVWWMAQRLVRPVPQLAQAAAKITGGDLATPIAIQGSRELRTLGATFETMRQSLQSSRDELAAWTGTLEQRVAQRSQEVAALSEVIASASHSQSQADLLQTALVRTLSVMNADMGGIWIADSAGVIHMAAQRGFNPGLQDSLARFEPGEGLLGRVQAQGAPIVLEDISRDPRLARATVREAGLHAFAAVPLRIYGRTSGVMGLFSHAQQGFSPESVALAASIAQQIALTLDNLALVERVQTQARDVASLQERERIAGELHDSIAQTLGYLYLQLDRLIEEAPIDHPGAPRDRLARLQDILDHATREVRQFIADLRDTPPPPARLATVLTDELAHLQPELNLAVTLDLDGAGETFLLPATGAELARIMGEALRNADKHGHARHAWVTFRRTGRSATLAVRDDGLGFDPAQPPTDGRGHFGLSVMKARAARLGGALRIESAAGAGTVVTCQFPVER